MKTGKILSLLLCFCLLFTSLPAFALTEAEKDTAFTAALMELESYLENPGVPGRSLDACIAAFGSLGKYKMSDSFKRYAMSVRMIEEGGFGWELEASLKAICSPEFSALIGELGSASLCTPETLAVYKNAREAERAGDAASAIGLYQECLAFYDSADRYFALTQDSLSAAYEKGMALLNAGMLNEAYYVLQECTGYELTDTILAMIVEELGHAPCLEHDWQPATCTMPVVCSVCGETKGEPAGHSWSKATCTEPAACSVCGATKGGPAGHSWRAATYTSPETCMVCGATRGGVLVTPAPTPKKISVRAGDVITFGDFGGEAIQWMVLEVQGDKALLLSKYGVDARRYNESRAKVTWESCSLRYWLNGEFYNSAFSSSEKNKIERTRVDNSKSQCYRGFKTDGGSDTQDYVFLLSSAEVNRYFGTVTEESRNVEARVAPNRYAKRNGALVSDKERTADGEAAGWWWLRSPGDAQNDACGVRDRGSIHGYYVDSYQGCVRPALWMKIS